MSGWNTADRMMEEETGDDFPAVNNISVAGYMPHDQVPAPGKLQINLQPAPDRSQKHTSSQLGCSASTVATCPL